MSFKVNPPTGGTPPIPPTNPTPSQPPGVGGQPPTPIVPPVNPPPTGGQPTTPALPTPAPTILSPLQQKERDLRKDEEKNRKFFWTLVWTINILVTAITVATIFMAPPLGLSLLLMLTTYTGASLHTVKVDERGLMLFFSKPLFEVSSGLYYTPFFLCTLHTLPKTALQREFPAEPERVWRGNTDDIPKDDERWRPAIRINHPPLTRGLFDEYSLNRVSDWELDMLEDGSIEKREVVTHQTKMQAHKRGAIQKLFKTQQEDYYNNSFTTEVSGMVSITIEAPWTFTTTIGSMDEMWKQVEDRFKSALAATLTKRTPRQAMDALVILSKVIEKMLDEKLHNWGAESEVKLNPLQFGKDLNVAAQAVAQAQATAHKTIIDADAAKQKEIKAGEGMGGKTAARFGLSGPLKEARDKINAERATSGEPPIELTSEQIMAFENFQEFAGKLGETTNLFGAGNALNDILAAVQASKLMSDQKQKSTNQKQQETTQKPQGGPL